jgi:hypothetical protein
LRRFCEISEEEGWNDGRKDLFIDEPYPLSALWISSVESNTLLVCSIDAISDYYGTYVLLLLEISYDSSKMV